MSHVEPPVVEFSLGQFRVSLPNPNVTPGAANQAMPYPVVFGFMFAVQQEIMNLSAGVQSLTMVVDTLSSTTFVDALDDDAKQAFAALKDAAKQIRENIATMKAMETAPTVAEAEA